MGTHTYAILDVTAETFRELQQKLEHAGYHHAFKEDDGSLIIDLHGIAIRDEDEPAPAEHEPGEPFVSIDPSQVKHERPS